MRGAAGVDTVDSLGRSAPPPSLLPACLPASTEGGENGARLWRDGGVSGERAPVLFLRPAECIRDVLWLSLSDKAGSADAHASAQNREEEKAR